MHRYRVEWWNLELVAATFVFLAVLFVTRTAGTLPDILLADVAACGAIPCAICALAIKAARDWEKIAMGYKHIYNQETQKRKTQKRKVPLS